MPASKNIFLDHLKWLRLAVRAHGAEFLIAGESMQALIRHRERHWALRPQFLAVIDGVSQYAPVMRDEVTHFAGWYPTPVQRWPVASDKLAFKRFAVQAGLAVPEFSTDPGSRMADVVVKRATSSFGAQVRGPFRSAAEHPLDVAQGDYYERFIEGELLKVWYWNGRTVVMERDVMPSVVGDGNTPLKLQIERRARLSNRRRPEWIAALLERCEAHLRFCGVGLDTVLEPGVRQRIEFRYGSELMLPLDRRVVDLRGDAPDAADPAWEPLRAAGLALHAAVPAVLAAHCLFAVDAIRDPAGRIWLLEVNSNPTVHPLVYPSMVASLMANTPISAPGATSVPEALRI